MNQKHNEVFEGERATLKTEKLGEGFFGRGWKRRLAEHKTFTE